MTEYPTFTDIQRHPLWPVQQELYNESWRLGAERYWRHVRACQERGRETNDALVRRLMDAKHNAVVQGIRTFVSESLDGAAHRLNEAATYMAQINPDMMTFLAMKTVMDALSQQPTLTKVAHAVGQAIEDELRFAAAKEKEDPAYWYAYRKAMDTQNAKVRNRKMRNRLTTEWEGWSRIDRVRIGAKMIDLIESETGLIEVSTRWVAKNRSQKVILVTDETLRWLEEGRERLQWMAPIHLPMVVPPRPWTSAVGGGHWLIPGAPPRLIKARHSGGRAKEYEAVDMPQVLSAVNAVQETAWRVNGDILDTMRRVWESDRDFPEDVVPPRDAPPEPPRPAWLEYGMTAESMTEDQVTEFRRWKRRLDTVKSMEVQLRSRRLSYLRMLDVAARVRPFEELFFPHQLDWRGRMYPTGFYLQPQGPDEARALLQFSAGLPIETEEAAEWLLIHGANTYGVDKVSFDERVAWVEANQRDILVCAEDPLACRFWMDADKPWLFLAWCFDYAGFLREGFGYESHLPIAMDGSNNGLQTYSAMLRDPIGGEAVNLVPGEAPEDVYARVALRVQAQVEEDAAAGNPHARRWLGRVDRKTCKRPVMTLAYGATRYGFCEMVRQDTIQPLGSDPESPFLGHEWDSAIYLGGLIWDACAGVVVKAAQAMEWLQKVTAEVGGDKAVVWTTPSGFIAHQEYAEAGIKRLRLTFGKERIRLNVADYGLGAKINKRKQVAGIAPNFVHSLDATHLALTVNAAAEAGLRSFAMIHDSYGTHAANAQFLARTLREQFVRLYRDHDPLKDFHEALQTAAGDDVVLPPPPEAGSLDIEQVLYSPYFFA